MPVLAERALMSERSFTRAFHREVGQSPAAYVDTLRIERARDLLEDGPLMKPSPYPPASRAPKCYAARFIATSASHQPSTATASSSAASASRLVGAVLRPLGDERELAHASLRSQSLQRRWAFSRSSSAGRPICAAMSVASAANASINESATAGGNDCTSSCQRTTSPARSR